MSGSYSIPLFVSARGLVHAGGALQDSLTHRTDALAYRLIGCHARCEVRPGPPARGLRSGPTLGDDSTKHLASKLLEAAQDRWRAVNSPHLVALVRAGARFDKGVIVERKALAGRLHETLESIIGSEALVPPTSTR